MTEVMELAAKMLDCPNTRLLPASLVDDLADMEVMLAKVDAYLHDEEQLVALLVLNWKKANPGKQVWEE